MGQFNSVSVKQFKPNLNVKNDVLLWPLFSATSIHLGNTVHLTKAFKKSYSVFTLIETETDTKTDPDKIAAVPNGFDVFVQYEHLHTILYKPFLSVSVSVFVSCQCEDPFPYSLTEATTTSRKLSWSGAMVAKEAQISHYS